MSKTNSFLKKPVATQKTAGKGDKKKGLGRGLGSLLSDSSLVSSHSAIESVSKQEDVASRQEQKVIELPILEIERSPYQPRREFSETQIQELADSIKNNGLVQPPVVRKNSSGKWELISGERRLRAAQLLNWRKIEVVVRDVDDITAATMTQTENLQREDLNPIEEAESYKILQDSFSLSQQDVAERVGKARATVANAVRLLELPEEVRELVSKRLLSVGHAKVILSLDSEKDRVLLARDCIENQLSVRALEKKIANRSKQVVVRPRGTPDFSEAYAKNLSDALRRHLGCAVRITSALTLGNGKRVKGVLEIDFFNNDDLDRVFKMIGVEVE